MNDGFWCKYCGKQKSWNDRNYDVGLFLAETASFEAHWMPKEEQREAD